MIPTPPPWIKSGPPLKEFRMGLYLKLISSPNTITVPNLVLLTRNCTIISPYCRTKNKEHPNDLKSTSETSHILNTLKATGVYKKLKLIYIERHNHVKQVLPLNRWAGKL